MRLKSVKLTHFRGYRATTVIPVDEAMTGIVGRNDYGKSTILEALAIFFECGDVKADKSDMNCFSLAEGAEQFEIACEFDGLPEALVLDENAETSLAQEYLLNAEGALEIVKTFKASTGKLERTATLDKLREMAPELANELTPRFKEKPKWSFSFTLDGENGIPINKRGSGVRRLILLNFFRAEAEKAVAGSQRNVIYAIEEPETSQHPNYQMMLMKALLELSNQPNRQIIVTTHVPALAGLMPINGIRYVTKDEHGIPFVKMPDNDVLKEAAESLGVLPETGMERAKGVVLVEGKSDVTFLRHASNTLKAGGHLQSSLEDAGIVPILIGGCGSVKHWVTLNLADDLGLPWCVFLDSDIGGTPEQVASIAKRKQEVEGIGRPFYSTRKREIENYLCPDMIDARTGVRVNFTDTCDAKKIIGKAVGIKGDDLIDKLWPHMTSEQILQRSMYQEGAEQRSELKDLVENLLALVP